MGICPNCGEWVDEGDICMSCGGGGGYSEDPEQGLYYRGDDYSSPRYDPPNPRKVHENRLKSDKRLYESKLEQARSEKNAMYRIRRYNEALDYYESYHKSSEIYGMEIDGMPDESHMLADSDLDWLRQRHYESQTKFSLFGNDERVELEKLLKRSGNASVIRSNESRLHTQRQIDHKQYLKRRAWELKGYFYKHLEKANALVDEGKHKKAMKEYRWANDCRRNYFDNYAEYDPDKDRTPDRFTPEAVEHIMVIYLDTHPLLTSSGKKLKVNREITEMLEGKWDESIRQADERAQEILDERRRRRKESAKRAGEAIADVIIAGDKLIKRFMR